jgi:outer membrane protein
MQRFPYRFVPGLFCILAGCLHAQPSGGQMPEVGSSSLYTAKAVPAVPLQNSGRLAALMRAGNIYLSLPDAIALALENNLDVEFQRYSPAIADSDVLRAKGGGAIRGVSLASTQAPAGVGGPASPLLNSATPGFTVATSVAANITSTAVLTSPSNNLSITSGTFSTGPALPIYDPTLVGSLGWNHGSTPQTNPLITGANVLVSRLTNGTASLLQGFSPGTEIGLNFTSATQNSNSIRSTLNPFNNSSVGLTFSQPLLRGFGPSVNRRYIRIAQNNRKVTDLVFRQQVMDTVSGIIRIYYDLVSLDQDVRVKQRTLELAQTLYANNKLQVEQGTLAPIELVRTQALIAASRQDLANSAGLEREQELILKTVLTRRGTADAGLREARIVPTDPIPVPAQEPIQPVQDLITAAFQNRPDLAAASLQLNNSQISLQGSRNALLPDVSLVANASNAGLAGTVNPNAQSFGSTGPVVVSPGFLGGVGSAIEQIFRRNYPTYGVGVQLNLPLRNRIAQADYVHDLLQLRQTEINRQRLENQVRLAVEDALIAIQRSRAAYDAAVESRAYQEQSLAAEQERFGVGLSTTFLIIQYQSQVAQARSTEVVARGAYAKARVQLQYAIGRTLEENNVSIDEAWRGQISRPPSPIPANPPQPAAPGSEFSPLPQP